MHVHRIASQQLPQRPPLPRPLDVCVCPAVTSSARSALPLRAAAPAIGPVWRTVTSRSGRPHRMAASPVAAAAAIDQTAPLYTSFSNPCYSLATNAAGPSGRPTLNLTTYCSPIAIKPNRCLALGLYRGTLSHEQFAHARRGVLQVLQQQHAELFTLLGKTSGRDTDKLGELRRRLGEGGLTQRFGHATLTDAACVMEVEAVSELMDFGDHDVVIVKVSSWQNLAGPERVLYTGELRAKGLM